MTNLLSLVPSLDRQLSVYRREQDTDSVMAGFLFDSIEGLIALWTRDYSVNFSPPATYICTPDIDPKDKRPIILMASIIYKLGRIDMAAVTDGDFSYNPFPRGKDTSAVALDAAELERYIPKQRLAKATSAPLRGFSNIFNSESYNWGAVSQLFL